MTTGRAELRPTAPWTDTDAVALEADIQATARALFAAVDRQLGPLSGLVNNDYGDFKKRVDESLAKATNSRATARFELRLVYEQKIDVEAETARTAKELEKLEAEFLRNGNQLGNQGFLAKAPAKVVEGLRTRRVELESLIEKSRARLGELGAGK